MILDFDKHIFCVITDGSHGIGQKIAEEFARRASFVTFLLIAQNEPGLSETKTLIAEVNQNAVVFCKALDLLHPDTDIFRQILVNSFVPNLYETAFIFHTAEQIGQIDKISKLNCLRIWQDFYNSDFFTVTLFNSVCLEVMKDIAELFVINITAYASRQLVKYLSMYSSSKAARDTYFTVLALEEPKISVLNYSPCTRTEELIKITKNYEDEEDSEPLVTNEDPVKLTPEQIALNLISLLEKGEYNSGDVIYYYD